MWRIRMEGEQYSRYTSDFYTNIFTLNIVGIDRFISIFIEEVWVGFQGNILIRGSMMESRSRWNYHNQLVFRFQRQTKGTIPSFY